MKFSNQFSRKFGRFANYKFPKIIQKIINTIYVKIFKIDLSEFDSLECYNSLNALFTRSLRVKRIFEDSKKLLISPTDSLITECGGVDMGKALQIKGMEYSIKELLGLNEGLQEGYSYINFYLSPRDYHRYHAPCDLEVIEVRYFAGELLPVNKPSLRKNTNLFIKNERVVVIAKDSMGEIIYFVAVGALNVGQMVLNFEPSIQTNTIAGKNTNYCYNTPIFVSKGEELGMFKMGSTVVVFAKNLKLSCAQESRVRFGDVVGEFI